MSEFDCNSYIKEYINCVKNALDSINVNEVSTVIEVLKDALFRNGAIYVFGNGGSASTASHMQNDFNKGVSEHYAQKYRFLCLSDNVSTITAIANDWSYEDVFYRQLVGRLKKEDLVIAISSQGNSKNIIKAVEYAKKIGCKTIGITGASGGELRLLADYHLHSNSFNVQVCEDLHLIFNHVIMSSLIKMQEFDVGL